MRDKSFMSVGRQLTPLLTWQLNMFHGQVFYKISTEIHRIFSFSLLFLQSLLQVDDPWPIRLGWPCLEAHPR